MVDKEIPLIKAKKTPEKDVVLDPNGFFVIEVYDKGIRVEYYSNVYKNQRIVSGHLEKVFVGTQADALSDTIAHHVPLLRPETERTRAAPKTAGYLQCSMRSGDCQGMCDIKVVMWKRGLALGRVMSGGC